MEDVFCVTDPFPPLSENVVKMAESMEPMTEPPGTGSGKRRGLEAVLAIGDMRKMMEYGDRQGSLEDFTRCGQRPG